MKIGAIVKKKVNITRLRQEDVLVVSLEDFR
jgi:hypothetical protein